MTKLVVGAPGDVSNSTMNSTMRRSKKLRASSSLDHSKSFLSKSMQFEASSQVHLRAGTRAYGRREGGREVGRRGGIEGGKGSKRG